MRAHNGKVTGSFSINKGPFFPYALVCLVIVTNGRAMAQSAPGVPAGDKAPAIQVPGDATVEELLVDFLHYARIGRFAAADAFAKALLAHDDLDPLKVLEAADKDRKSVETLLILIKNSSIGESAQRVLDLIEKGENLRRQDTPRIQANIDLLTGDPQQEFIACSRLAQSGEYAIPLIVQTLQDQAKSRHWPRIIQCLPKIGKPALNPLVVALNVSDNNTRLHLIRALGEIGYPQAIPYLLKLSVDANMPAETKDAAAKAVPRIEEIAGRRFPGGPHEHFFLLGERYYNEEDSVAADPRLPESNLWYWDAGAQALSRMVVSERLFGPIMAMRCCEEGLLLQNDHPDSLALWLAANIRRESRLGMNIESGDPKEQGAVDPSRPANFPRALYFTQAAGPRYAQRVLQRAVQDADSAVALGAIEALRVTAGESSLIGMEDEKQPLVRALRFPDLVVRIRAALALGAALPKSQFADSQFVVPVLAQALAQTGREQVLVVDPDEANLNRVVGLLRTSGREVIGEKNFDRALNRARTDFQALAGVFVSSGVADPDLRTALQAFQGEFLYSKTPVVVLTKAQHAVLAEEAGRGFVNVESIDAAVDNAAVEDAFARVQQRAGQARLDPALAQSLALEAAEALRRIAVDGRTVYDFGAAEPALIGALSSLDERLQITAASVLALARTPTAQRAIAHVALDGGQSPTLRLAAFDSLAESAKTNGPLLEDAQAKELIRLAKEEPELTMRTAASQALGALNLRADRAGEIIRGFYGG